MWLQHLAEAEKCVLIYNPCILSLVYCPAFIECQLEAASLTGDFIASLVNLGESGALCQISTFPLGIICIKVNKALGAVNSHSHLPAHSKLQKSFFLAKLAKSTS